MTERIRELAEIAIEEKLTLSEFIDELNKDPYDFYAFRVREMEKFAELIVRECCFIGEQYANGLIDIRHYDFVNTKIKQHFGVEE